MITNNQIMSALSDLDPQFFKIDCVQAWYSTRSLLDAFGVKNEEPEVKSVRVRLKGGVLELHPQEDNSVEIMCYCCFGGNPDKGRYPLEGLKEAVIALREHRCPLWGA